MRVALVTCHEHPTLTLDDQPLLPALAGVGIQGVPAIWNDPAVEWAKYDAVVIRTPWDYWAQPKPFADWLNRLESLRVYNPVSILKWNMDKSYLRELEHKIPLVPTVWISFSDLAALYDELARLPWHELIVKPAISAGAYNTIRIATAAPDARQKLASLELTPGTVLLAQPLQREILDEGEWSFVFFANEFSHATIKRPALADFRVQEEHGGSVDRVAVPLGGLEAAKAVLERVNTPLLYARVDMVRVEGEFRLMELEALEPSLYFKTDPEAPHRFARALKHGLSS